MDINSEMKVLFEMKRLCNLYIEMASDMTTHNRSENPVILNATRMLASVKQRLSHFCEHDIIEDEIEIGDTVKKVVYCRHCETNFSAY
jgi:transcriptional regulator